MTVRLPSNGIAAASPYFIDYGGVTGGSIGGPDQRLDRLGSRWGCDFTTKPMKGEEARIWIARLIVGVREKAIIKFPQPGVVVLHPELDIFKPTMAANAEVGYAVTTFGGGGTSKATLKEGQFISWVQDGKNYLHQSTRDQSAGAPEAEGIDRFNFRFQPPVRRATVADGTKVNFTTPDIEGYVKGDAKKWNIDQARIYGLSFTIEEAE